MTLWQPTVSPAKAEIGKPVPIPDFNPKVGAKEYK